MQPESAAFLWDVRAAGNRVAEFTVGLTRSSYADDELRKSAVERQLEIIGEALNKLRKIDPEVAEGSPDLARIVGLRNILIHGYAVVDDSVVWTAASERVPGLLKSSTDCFPNPGELMCLPGQRLPAKPPGQLAFPRDHRAPDLLAELPGNGSSVTQVGRGRAGRQRAAFGVVRQGTLYGTSDG